MLKIIIISIFAMLIITSCAKASSKEALVKEITKEYEKQECKKHGLLLVGSGSAIPDQIHAFILHFFSYQKLNQDEARKLVVDLVNELILKVNQNEKIQKYLINTPFNEKNYELLISIVDSNNKTIAEPYVGEIIMRKGEIIYFFIEKSEKIPKDFTTTKETYEEALRKVRQEK